MRVCEDDSIDPVDLLPQHLLAEVRPRVNDQALIPNRDMNGGSQSFVSKVQ
jgi:hypothetical protein